MTSNNKNLRFIHIPKNAGSSLIDYLDTNGINYSLGVEPTRKGSHRPSFVWRDEDTLKFTICRNPYTRVVSYYNYISQNEENWNHTFEEFVRNSLVPKTFSIPNPWIPQAWWICDNIVYQKIVVDQIFKMEDNLEVSLNSFFGVNYSFPKMNVSTFDDYDKYYSVELRNIIYQRLRIDFELLEYKK